MRADGSAPTIILRHLVQPSDSFAYLAALAFECAASQQRAATAGSALFAQARSQPSLDLHALASTIGIERDARLGACLDDPRTRERLAQDSSLARDLRIQGTPTLFTPQLRIRGALSRRELQAALRRSLTAQ